MALVALFLVAPAVPVHAVQTQVVTAPFNQAPGSVANVPQAPRDLWAEPRTNAFFHVVQDHYVDDAALLHWTVPASDGGASIVAYDVYRSFEQGAQKTLIIPNQVGESAYDNACPRILGCYYQVRAVNVAGEGPLSNEVFVPPMTPIACSNDQMSCAWEVVGPQHLQSTFGFTMEPGEAGYCHQWGATAWFVYRPSTDGVVAVDASGSSYPTAMTLYIPSGNIQYHSCDDSPYPGLPAPTMSFYGIRGQTYYIQVGSYWGDGAGILDLKVSSPLPPVGL